jgi:hypothetical protein
VATWAALSGNSKTMIRKSVAEILDQHVTFEWEAIDRMYLNGYVPSLQSGGGVVYFMKQHLGARVPSTTMVAPLTKRFVDAKERFAETAGVDLVTFEKDQRKDAVAQRYLAAFTGDKGVLFIGKARVVDTQRAAALCFGDCRVLALMQTLCLFALSPTGFRHRDVRAPIAQLLGRHPDHYAAGHITYDLRRLRLQGLIERVPHTHRYRITEHGARMAILYVRVYARGFRPPASLPSTGTRRGSPTLERLDAALTKFLEEVRLAA